MISRADKIYPLDRLIKKELEKLKKDPHNGKDILGYYHRSVAEGKSKARILKIIRDLRLLSQRYKKPFKGSMQEDFEKFFSQMQSKDYSPWTMRDYKTILRKYYKWLVKWPHRRTFPPEVDWIVTPNIEENKYPVLPQDLLTAEEKQAMLNACQNPRDRAFIHLHIEAGRRPEENLTLCIEDIEFDDLGAKLYVHGKKGPDYVRIIDSVPDLLTWLNLHPKSKGPVWICLEHKNKNKQLSYYAARALIKRVAKDAGINKRVYAYLFRFTKADDIFDKINEAQQCVVMGWKLGSKMPRIYQMRYGKHIDKAAATLSGIKPVPQQVKEMPKQKICKRCTTTNSVASKFCNKCGCVLDLETALEIDNERREYEEKLNELVKDPEKLQKLVLLLESTNLPDPKR